MVRLIHVFSVYCGLLFVHFSTLSLWTSDLIEMISRGSVENMNATILFFDLRKDPRDKNRFIIKFKSKEKIKIKIEILRTH